MKKLTAACMILLFASTFTSCATILGGKVSDCQRTKPSDGDPSRKVRMGALVADLLLTGAIGTVIDFATGAIYKPCSK